MTTLTIENLWQAVTKISRVKSDSLSEYCIVALEAHNNVTGCTLNVSGDKTDSFSLQWSKIVNKSAYQEHTEFKNHGAEAIAFFLTRHLTPYTIIRQAPIKTGIDWWLDYTEEHPNYDPDNFLRARLEVSGIGKETPSNSLKRRVREKKQQTQPTDYTKLPAHIAVIVFSPLKAYFGKK